MARRLRLLTAACVLAGCGGGGEGPPPAASATAAPADLVARAQECGLPAPGQDAVPAELAALLPARSVVVNVQPAGAGYRAVAFAGLPLVETLAALGRAATGAGYAEAFREREAIDAELTVRSPDGHVVAFTLATPAGCEDGVRVTAVRIG